MTTCFCGCGNEIGGFQLGRRRANDSGAKVSRLLSEYAEYFKPWIDAGRPGFVEPAVAFEGPDEFEQYLIDVAEGTDMRDAFLACVHEVPGVPMPDKGSVKAWCKNVELQVAVARMPLEARQKFLNAVHYGTVEEIARTYEDGVKAT
ncbi:MAG: hypothetical protein ACRDKE_11390 [Solirubrobacterales bacterium]